MCYRVWSKVWVAALLVTGCVDASDYVEVFFEFGGEDDSEPVDTDSVKDTAPPPTDSDPRYQECLDRIGWDCTCHGDCEDGFGYTMYYPNTAGVDPAPDCYPSQELRDVGIAWYYCSICSQCEEWSRVKDDDGNWIDVSKEAFCRVVVETQDACDDCIVTVSGGGG